MFRKFFLLVGVVFVLVTACVGWFFYAVSPVSSDKTLRRFVVSQGEVANGIGQELSKENFIRSAIAFRIYAQITQSAKDIQAGSYDLPSNLWVPQIIDKFLAGPTEVWVTIPEGLRREEVSQKFVEGLELSGKAASDFSAQFLKLTSDKEGYLFPDTYLISRDASAAAAVSAMESNFGVQYAKAEKMKSVGLDENQVVILASIVQREAISPQDMQGVASVLENRLAIGMPLGSDVTLEYALGKQSDGSWWKKDLTVDDLALDNLYNTRLNAGLPPTPISNPGLVAIEAVLNPPATNYLYYLSDSNGKLHFAATLDEHNANIAKYLQ